MQAGNPAKNKREEIVQVASGLFYKQGYGSTGIKQIIETVGIAKGTFYTHFKCKEELGIAWLTKRHTLWNSWLVAELDKSKSPKGKILALFDFLEKWMLESEFRGCAFLNTMAEVPDFDNPMRHEVAAHKSALQRMIQSLAAQHFTGKKDDFTKQKGTFIFLLFEGALIEAQNFQETWPITAARQEIKGILENQ